MTHTGRVVGAVLIALVAGGAGCGEDGTDRPTRANGGAARPSPSPAANVEDPDARARREHEAMLDRDWPLHGLVTGLQIVVRERPDPEARPIGWLRIGSRIRLRPDPVRTPTCQTGWYRIHPHGHACAGQGIAVDDEPPPADFVVRPPAREQPLPYEYWYVKEEAVPEYYTRPSRDDQRAALAFAQRLLELRRSDPTGRKAARLLAGELPGEPRPPEGVHRFLERGFFVAGAGVEVRAQRRFVRTVRGRFVKQSQLERREGSAFRGVVLGPDAAGATLPVAWAVRAARPLLRRDRADGTVRFVEDEEAEPIARLTRLETWVGTQNIGGERVHVLRDAEGRERYLRHWFVAVAERVERPREVRADERWAHVDLGSQTLVVYQGDEPVFATLVSTGLPGHETPTGLFRIRAKYIADTMGDLGADLDERYSIEDVPWTQYFSGSIALHGAFWHGGFGQPRSHGCVNLSPADAHQVFDLLAPAVPEGWLGVSAEPHSPFGRGSAVVVTP
ncbi:MAG: L,D-transpeptidase [Myxococcota bacterium]|nr:L,D-transpeptidase [Myxococcota bacterium]MDW8364134.1 L,D-transpeptidase [Myxococcales bacterium]